MTQPRVHTVGRASRSGHDLILSASLSVQVADPCSQIKTGDVAIHSELLLHCIPSCIRDQCNRHISRFLSVVSPATEHVRTVRLVRQRREGGLASQHSTCFFGLFAIGCLPRCSCGSSDSGPRGRHARLHCPLAAVPQSKTNVLLSVCFGSRQTRVVAPRARRPALIGLEAVRCGLS